MAKHVIKQGECLSSLAAALGLPSWKDLHDHPDNAELKKRRPNPNLLLPGDVVIVPDAAAEKKTVTCAADKKHKFVVQVPRVKLRLLLQSWKGEPYRDKKFEVTLEGKKIAGRTDGSGFVAIDIPATAQRGRLKVWFDEDPEDPGPNIDRELAIGYLDPVDSLTGVQARLANLGYRCDVSGELDEATVAAARAFRAEVGLPEVEDRDAIDSALRARLRKQHDGEE